MGAGLRSGAHVSLPVVPQRAAPLQALASCRVVGCGGDGDAWLRCGLHAGSIPRLSTDQKPCGTRPARRKLLGGRGGPPSVPFACGEYRALGIIYGGTLPPGGGGGAPADQVVRSRSRLRGARLGGQHVSLRERRGDREPASGSCLTTAASLLAGHTARCGHSHTKV